MLHNPERRKILAILCTNNKINKELLSTVINQVHKAQGAARYVDVEVVVCAWEPVENNPFEEMITPFRELGHLNYILQLKEVLTTHKADIVSVLEHDVLYPENYFNTIIQNWNFGLYGLWNNNYIGMNETGYLDVKERHQPFSMMSAAKFYLEKNLDLKLNECMRRVHEHDGWEVKYGWACIEPDNKTDFGMLPFTDEWPCIHVNMNHLGPWGSGKEGKNHHFTAHCEVCYDEVSNGVTFREDWGDYKQYFPLKPKEEGEILGQTG